MEDFKYQKLQKAFEEKSDEELLSIWEKKDTTRWDNKVFEVIHDILVGRDIIKGEVIHKIEVKSQTTPQSQKVVVTDIKMSFESMVVFMIKWVIASIPAIIVLSIVFMLLTFFFSVLGLSFIF